MDNPQVTPMELMLAAGSVITAIGAGVIAVKVDLAKLKVDVTWIKQRLQILERKHESD